MIALLVALLFGARSFGQCLSLPGAFDQKLESSDRIFEGKVIAQQSFFGNDGNIYTSNQVEVYRALKGDVGFESSVITEGGIVGDLMQMVTPSVTLKVGDYGVFTVSEETTTEFIQIDEVSGSVYGNHRFSHREALYENIARHTGSNAIELRRVSPNAFQSSEQNDRATPSISNASPSLVTAGTQTILSIQGSGFGDEQGDGHVAFSNADDGGQSFVALQPGPHYLSWSDSEIQLYVPSATLYNSTVAGTGQVQVRNGQGLTGLSDQEVTVRYAKSEVVYNQNLNTTALVGMQDGGYAFSINQQLNAFLGGDELVRKSFEKWACNTGVNFMLTENVVPIANWAHDEINLIGLSTPGQLPSYLLGKTITTFSGCGTPNGLQWNLVEVDVLLNGDKNWRVGEGVPMQGQFDLETSVLHELGHAQLLQHNNNPESPMYFELTEGASRRHLDQATDIDGGVYIAHESANATHTCGDEVHQLYDDTNCNLSLINGIEEEEVEFSVYPNPFRNELNIVLDSGNSGTVSILDSQGKLLRSEILRRTNTIVRTDKLPSGIYLLVITTEQGRFSQKLVKN